MSKRQVLTPEREAEFKSQFPHHSDPELAKRFGITVRQAQYLGFKSGLSKTAATRSASRRMRHATGEAMTVRVERLVDAAGQLGASRDQLERSMSDVTPSAVEGALNKLVADRRVFRAGRKGYSRWFKQLDWAQGFANTAQASGALPKHAQPANAPVVHIAHDPGPARSTGDALVPEGLQIQYGAPVPGPEARWHGNARPIFSGLGPGLYTDQPSSWVKAVTSKP